jgi:hypothetical protein
VGKGAGETDQGDNSIVINATGNPLNNSDADRFFVKPIRTASVTSNTMAYTSGTSEVSDNPNVSFDTGGNVGIGITNPSANLHVNRTGSMIVPVGNEGQRPGTAQSGMLRFNDSTKTLEFYSGTGWFPLAISGSISSGGIVTENDGFRTHIFRSSGTFSLLEPISDVEVLVVGGGGGGSNISDFGPAGGGGGGEVVSVTGESLTAQPYTVIVGAGGVNANGGDSTFHTFTGRGGGRSQTAGGSGGGGNRSGTGATSTAESPGIGNNGGTPAGRGSGGGGGATEPGFDNSGNTERGGNGGEGLPVSISGTETVYGSGGGGGRRKGPSSVGIGGTNAGNGGGGNPIPATSGVDGTGSGGGGAGIEADIVSFQIGGKGGSGIVIIRYQI